MMGDRSAVSSAQPDPAWRYVAHLQAIQDAKQFASKGERTRFRLKLAAVRALEETDYQDLKVSEICSRADVALGTFYVYFRDKATIATEVILEFGEELYNRAQLGARGRNEFEAILLTNRFFASAYPNNAGLVRCLIQLQDQVPEFRGRWRERRLEWIEGLARSIARRSGHLAGPPPMFLQIAHALEGMVFHYFYEVFVRRDPVLEGEAADPDELAELLSILWYRAVYCENPPAELIEHARSMLALHRAPRRGPVVTE